MLKKTLFALMAAMFLTTTLVGVASAQTSKPSDPSGESSGRKRAAIGQIKSIGSSSFNMMVRKFNLPSLKFRQTRVRSSKPACRIGRFKILAKRCQWQRILFNWRGAD